MKKFGKNILSHLNAKTKIGLGINTPADIQDFAVNQYKEVLALKEQIDKRAESKLSENPTIEVIYNWTDVDAKQRRSKANLQVLKNQIEIFKSSGNMAKELTNVIASYSKALRQAISDYVNKGNDYVIINITNQMNRYIKENKYGIFNTVIDPHTKKRIENIHSYDDINNICRQVEMIKFQLENSEEWHRAHLSRDIVKNKKR